MWKLPSVGSQFESFTDRLKHYLAVIDRKVTQPDYVVAAAAGGGSAVVARISVWLTGKQTSAVVSYRKVHKERDATGPQTFPTPSHLDASCLRPVWGRPRSKVRFLSGFFSLFKVTLQHLSGMRSGAGFRFSRTLQPVLGGFKGVLWICAVVWQAPVLLQLSFFNTCPHMFLKPSVTYSRTGQVLVQQSISKPWCFLILMFLLESNISSCHSTSTFNFFRLLLIEESLSHQQQESFADPLIIF